MQKQPEVGVLLRRAFTPEIRSIDEAKRRITFTASDESVDRYGDILRVKGWKLDAYKKNPVVLWAHQSRELPVGKCVDCRVEDSPPALVQTVEFADHEFAKTVFDLYKGKFLNAVSVGFLPLEAPNSIKDENGNTTGGYEFTSQELLELSCVPVPANPQALARMVTKGFAVEDLKRVFSPQMSAEEVYKEVAAINSEIASVAVALATRVVCEALAFVKAAGVRSESGGEMSFEDLLAAVRQAGVAAETSDDITSVEQLGEEPETITTLEELAAAVGSSDGIKQFEKAVGIEEQTSWNGSSKWRNPGRLRKE